LPTKNIVILTSKTGGGHLSLAEALRDLVMEQTEQQATSAENDTAAIQATGISLIDPQPGLFHLHYRLVSRHALRLWAAEFQFFDTPGRALLAHSVFTRLVERQLHALLDRLQPDLLITTYPFLSYEVGRILEQRATHVPLVLFFSDAQHLHASWLSERRATATFAPTRETYEQALAAGFAPERLHLVGWPVRKQFFQAYASQSTRQLEQRARLGLDPERFTIFLQGGGEGAAHLERTLTMLHALSACGETIQIILATGTNRALQKRYQMTRNLAILPHTRNIAPYMATADLIMGKAGPNMLCESMMLGKPFLATTYIPGQEEANLDFIQRHGLGWVALDPLKQQALLTTLLHTPEKLAEMSATIKAYRQWNVEMNQRIVPLLCAQPGS